MAEQRYDSLGRTALWRVLSAEPGAVIRIGFREKVTAEALYDAAQKGRLASLLNEIPVQGGDQFLLEPGVPFAFSGKARILEIAEASSLVFDLSDPEDLIDAFDFILLERYPLRPGLADTPHFRFRQALGAEDGEAAYVLHLSPDASSLTLFPAEAEKGPFPKEGFFILPGQPAILP